MANLTRLTGSPWHTEKMARAEGDPRRHRSRCVYYTKETRHCSKRVSTCAGAAHCPYYEEYDSEPAAPPPMPKPEPAKPRKTETASEFDGIKMIPMSLIDMGKIHFHAPDPKKVREVEAHYQKHGKLDKPVVVSVENGRYYLEDKYLRYFVAKKLGLTMIPARMGSYRDKNIDELIRKTGQMVVHKHFGKGHVKECTLENVVIVFESGKTITFQIKACIEGKIITIP